MWGRGRDLASLARLLVLSLALLLALGLGRPIMGAEPSAVVEDVSAGVAGVAVFEFLEPGRVVELDPGQSLVLGYLASCVKETIAGGRVTIGLEESLVAGGVVVREIVECRGGRAVLTSAEAASSGVVVMRGGAGSESDPFVIYSLHPAFIFPNAVAHLQISRLDRIEPEKTLAVEGQVLDLAHTDQILAGGGYYVAQSGEEKRHFKIAVYARPGGALVSRLVRF